MKKTLIEKEELLKVSLAEAEEKHQKAVETNAQLEAKISDLMYQVETLQGTMQDMGNLLYETNRECDQLTNEREREREAHSILQAESDEMKKTLIQKEELLKASLAEAEEKHQKAVETIAQLEVEKSNLTYQVETLRGTVQESGNLLSETHRQCDELTNECEREREAHSILQSEHNEMKEKLKHCEELLMEREREREVHSILQVENDEMKNTLTDIEELLKVSLAEAEEKHQKAVETNAQLEAKISDLMYQVETLQGTMQDMGNLLYETNRECDQLTNEREREREAHSILQAENDELKKTLIQKEELLKASLAEAEEKHQKAVETIAQLEVEKSNLTYQVETLRGTVQESGNLLSETHRQCDELTNECEREREAHSILQSEHNETKEKLKHCEELLMEREREREVHSILQAENDEMKNTLTDIEELLKVSLAEAEEKHQKAVETNAQLEAKISDLMYQVETLQGTMQDMGNLLYETNRECDQLTNEREREREAHSILQAENDEMKKTLIQKEELLKASLAEAEEKHQKAVETIAQLEVEKSNLTYQVETLRGTVQESGNLLSETHRQCDELTNECEREREAHSILQSEHNEMKEKLKHCEELLMEREREQEVHSILQAENDEMKNTLMDIEELLKVSLAEAEEKHQKAVETNAQLEAKISDLMYQVETLQGTMQDMGNLLYETNRECDQLTNEHEQELEAHSILQAENDELKKTLIQKEELLKASLAEAEEKHQKAVETIAQLEVEKSNLTYQVETLRGTVQESGNLLSETHRQCDELTNECEREREAHSILQSEHNEMKEKLKHCEELLMEREREQEVHSILQAENDEMKNTLTDIEELLKVSLAEAEEKHQKAVETNAQLEAKISDLMYQVETLQGTVQDMGNLLYETNRECDQLTNECEREREGHSILQSEHNETKEKLKHCEELLMECERQREAHSVLNFGFDEMKETLMHNEKLLKECEREREAHHKLKLEYDEMKKTLTHSEELLKVSLAEVEEKYNKAVESIAKLEAEKSNLKHHMETVRDTMQDIRNVLSETDTPCDELTNKHGVPLGSKETTSIERGSSVRRIGSTSKSL
ncbi:myosin-6-like [Pangasianodon hypophthalmus]|uniref:myosin-6-like n=1 Tax=Pangasianodon hypophthalmus TaxID=310915 RepID=UPI0023079431|nr:myosin-6-like [Pangasianodon hypophthalmus]